MVLKKLRSAGKRHSTPSWVELPQVISQWLMELVAFRARATWSSLLLPRGLQRLKELERHWQTSQPQTACCSRCAPQHRSIRASKLHLELLEFLHQPSSKDQEATKLNSIWPTPMIGKSCKWHWAISRVIHLITLAAVTQWTHVTPSNTIAVPTAL